MLVFVNQKNNEVKNKEKSWGYGKDHSQVEVKLKDKVKELAGQANLTLSKGVTKLELRVSIFVAAGRSFVK
jgi:hypothetical protein